MKMAGVESMVVEEVKPTEKPVDREKVRNVTLKYSVTSKNLISFQIV